VRSSAYGSRFRVQGLESGNVDPMRATRRRHSMIGAARKLVMARIRTLSHCHLLW
jgi:hypothetical protein